jgi:hypothetical protein
VTIVRCEIYLLVGGHGGTILYKHRVEYAIHESKSIDFSDMARDLKKVLWVNVILHLFSTVLASLDAWAYPYCTFLKLLSTTSFSL